MSRAHVPVGLPLVGAIAWAVVMVMPVAADPVEATGGLTSSCRAELAIGRNAGSNLRFRVDQLTGGSWSAVIDDGGAGWGESRGVTALAMGDVDGDGDDELAIGRNGGSNMRYQVLEYDGVDLEVLHEGGTGWGDSRGVTALAMGDVDGDGDDELALGRNGGGNMRFEVLDHDDGAWTTILDEGGTAWGESRGVSALAMGDVDGDGNDELALGRNLGGNDRYQVHDFDDGDWNVILDDGGTGWGDSRGVSALAMGDVDGDGNDELALGRNPGDNDRYQVHDFDDGDWNVILDDGGTAWGDSRGVSALAMGDVDGDGNDELALGRNPGDNDRYQVHDFDDGDWNVILDDGGTAWGDSRGVSALAMGDVDGDGNDELALGRNPGDNDRYQVHDYVDADTWEVVLDDGGTGWGDSRGVTALAMPEVTSDRDGDGLPDCWEVNGYDADGDGTADVILPGADPERRDVYVEIDCLVQLTTGVEGPHTHCPRMDALTSAALAFANAPVVNLDGTTGIQPHVDVGPLFGDGAIITIAGGGGAVGAFGDFEGGNTIQETGNEIIDYDGAAGDPATDFGDLKATNFDENRLRIYRYSIFGHQTNFRAPANDCTSGWASGGEQFLVTLGGTGSDGFNCWGSDANGWSVGNADQQAGTLLHELGHAIGLAHGGTDGENRKPHYLSVMNYLFQDCAVPTSPVQPGIPGGCDYSVQALPSLDESALDECAGIDGGVLGFGPMNWDGGGFSGPTCLAPGPTVSADINGDGDIDVLAGAEDWNDLSYGFSTGVVGDGGVDARQLATLRRVVGEPIRPRLTVQGPQRPVPVSAAGTIVVRLRASNDGGGPAMTASIATNGASQAFGPLVATAARAVVLTVPVPSTACDELTLSLRITTTDLFGVRRVQNQALTVPLEPTC